MKTITLIAALVLFSFSSVIGQTFYGAWNTEVTNEKGEKVLVQLTLKEDRTYTVDFGIDNNVEVQGAFTFSETQITVWDTTGEYACPADAKGVYEYDLTDKTFIMTKIKDDCEGRGASGKMEFNRPN